MKELFERHRDHLTPEEDQTIWGHVEQKLSVERSFWKSWRLPVSLAATASAALVVLTLTRGSHELATVNVRSIESPAPRLTVLEPPPLTQQPQRGTEVQALPQEVHKDAKRQADERKLEDGSLGSAGEEPAANQPSPAAPNAVSVQAMTEPDQAGVTVSEGKPSDSFSQAMKRKEAQEGSRSFDANSNAPQLVAPPASASTPTFGKPPQIKTNEMHLRGGRKGEVQVQTEGLRAAPQPSDLRSAIRTDESGAPNSVGGTTPVNGQAFDAMFFQHYGVNPFIDPEDDKFATFAMDVDNASYTLTRSYLERGALPPAEAVRVEEFVNAMRHDYAPPRNPDDLNASRDWAPSDHGTFAIHLEAAPSPFGPGLVLFRVGLKGKEIAVSERKPANLTFVVDVSGSMQREDRLELVKRSLFYLLDQMNNRDRVALVVYGTNARVVLPSTSLRDRQTIEDAIVRLQPEGSTNAEAGLREGYAVANESFNARANNRIVLCTDGVANVGLTDADDILDTIGRSARRGIALTAIGVGMGNYNDVLIEKLADKGDGNYYYVDDLAEAKKVFVENLTGTLQTIAKDAKIQVEFVSDAVRRYRLLGYENRDVADRDFRNNSVDAGEVGAGHEVTALFEMKMDRRATRGPVATVRIRYQDAETGRVIEEARTLQAEDILGRIQNADPTFKMDAAVAEFAEILRHSYWAKDGNLESARELAQNASRSMDSPKDAKEAVSLMGTAEQIWSRTQPVRWLNDDLRPQWEPGQENEER
jgi:Ca-activated chloride channel homolog